MAAAAEVYGNRYEIIRHLARGGMAEVYLARDQLLDRQVALKVLFPELSADPSFVERFRREAQAAANLNHPNIVSVYDWGEDGSTYFIVMEYVDGQTLRDLIRAGRLAPQQVADVGADIAAALSFAHRNGVIHRDVKPGNVLITSTGQVKVTDFGIARAARENAGESLTQTGTVMGTATYFSPEQAQGIAIDARSDVYALGVVLYEMVAGKPPFTGDNPVAIAFQHVKEAPPPLVASGATVPSALEAVIMKSLAKAPDDRYPSANDLRNDLLRFREGKSVSVSAAEAAAVAAAPSAEATQVVQATRADATRVATAVTTVAGGPPPAPPRRTGLYVTLLLVLLGILALLVFLLIDQFATDGDGAGGTIAVPNVIGKPVAEAAQEIADAGLRPVQEERENDAFDPGVVFETNPAADTRVEEDSEVTLFVAAGAPEVAVPNVVGQQSEDARRVLETAGFVVVEQPEESDQPAGEVLRQNPAGGTAANEGTEVTIVVAAGPEEVEVPDVSDRTESEAANILGRAGFETRTVRQPSSSVEAGKVIGTDPPAGTKAPRGSTVTINVSSGAEEVTVPSVVGLTEAEARAVLEDAGFSVVARTAPVFDPSEDGIVQRQSPSGGSQAARGSTVTILVGEFDTVETTEPTATTTPGGVVP
jgi:eukaryotic-like serine/threonine-protein kinase